MSKYNLILEGKSSSKTNKFEMEVYLPANLKFYTAKFIDTTGKIIKLSKRTVEKLDDSAINNVCMVIKTYKTISERRLLLILWREVEQPSLLQEVLNKLVICGYIKRYFWNPDNKNEMGTHYEQTEKLKEKLTFSMEDLIKEINDKNKGVQA